MYYIYHGLYSDQVKWISHFIRSSQPRGLMKTCFFLHDTQVIIRKIKRKYLFMFRCWLRKFWIQNMLANVKQFRKAASSDENTATTPPVHLQKIIDESDNNLWQKILYAIWVDIQTHVDIRELILLEFIYCPLKEKRETLYLYFFYEEALWPKTPFMFWKLF